MKQRSDKRVANYVENVYHYTLNITKSVVSVRV